MIKKLAEQIELERRLRLYIQQNPDLYPNMTHLESRVEEEARALAEQALREDIKFDDDEIQTEP